MGFILGLRGWTFKNQCNTTLMEWKEETWLPQLVQEKHDKIQHFLNEKNISVDILVIDKKKI